MLQIPGKAVLEEEGIWADRLQVSFRPARIQSVLGRGCY